MRAVGIKSWWRTQLSQCRTLRELGGVIGFACRQRRLAAPRWASATLARRTHDPTRRGDRPGHHSPLRPRRAASATVAPFLVSVFRGRDGDGLALFRHHHERVGALKRGLGPLTGSWGCTSAAAAENTHAPRRGSWSPSATGSGSMGPPWGAQVDWSRRSIAPLYRMASNSTCTASSSPTTAMGRRTAGHERRARQARRYHWLSEGLTSFVDAPHAAIEGRRARRNRQPDRPARGASRAHASCSCSARELRELRPWSGERAPSWAAAPDHASAPRRPRGERHHAPTARRAGGGGRARAGRLCRCVDDARCRRSNRPRWPGGRGRSWRAESIQRPSALLAGARRQGPTPVSGAA